MSDGQHSETATTSNPYAVTGGKVILFISTVIVAIASFSIATNLLESLGTLRYVIATLAGAVGVLTHVFVGARAVRVAEDLMAWGFPADYGSWKTESRLVCGAIWFVVIAFWAVVAAFNRTVTRLYTPPEK